MAGKILVIVDGLQNHYAELKIRENHLELPVEGINALRASDLREGLEWLGKICENELRALISAKRLLTPEQWKQYELFGMEDFEDHQEVIILRKAQVELRKVLVSQDRPNLFKKGYIDRQLSAKTHNKKSKNFDEGRNDAGCLPENG